GEVVVRIVEAGHDNCPAEVDPAAGAKLARVVPHREDAAVMDGEGVDGPVVEARQDPRSDVERVDHHGYLAAARDALSTTLTRLSENENLPKHRSIDRSIEAR